MYICIIEIKCAYIYKAHTNTSSQELDGEEDGEEDLDESGLPWPTTRPANGTWEAAGTFPPGLEQKEAQQAYLGACAVRNMIMGPEEGWARPGASRATLLDAQTLSTRRFCPELES